MNYKPDKIQPIFPILKVTLALGVFYLIAILISPAKIYTAIYYLRIFIPLVIIAAVYMIMASRNAEIRIEENSITLNLDFGRNKSTEVDYSFINSCTISKNALEKLFNVYSVKLMTLSTEPKVQKEISFINQYMIFSSKTAENINQHINNIKRLEV